MRSIALSMILLISSLCTSAQLTSNSAFLQGRYLEAGMSNNGTFCACNDIPSNFHKNPVSNTQIGLIFDHNLDGWNTGTPAFMGDYLTFGSGYDNWTLQAGDQLYTATKSCIGSISPASSMTGTNTGYYNQNGKMGVQWQGTAMAGALEMNMETTLDTQDSWILITVKLRNNGTTAIPNVYFSRYCEPDIDVYWAGGSGLTSNEVTYKDDIRKRNLVSAYGTLDNTYLGIGSTDSRAKVLHFNNLFSSTITRLDNIYAETVSSTNYVFSQGLRLTNNNYIGIIFKLDTIKPGDSTMFSYAYILNDPSGLDSAYIGNCNGTPLAGAISSNTNLACSSTNIRLDVSDYSFTSGRRFDWEDSYDGNIWNTIAGANTSTYSFSGLATSKYYRCKVGCVSGAGYSYTPAKKITHTYICPCVNLNSGIVSANMNLVNDTSILTLFCTGNSTAGTMGRWQSSTDSLVWTDLAFTYPSMSITGIKENTYFRYRTTCITSGEITYTSSFKITYVSSTTPVTISKNNNENEIYTYPNPATQQLYISATAPIRSVVISNTMGQLLLQYSPKAATQIADVSKLPPGVYIVRVNDVWVRRFVKE